MPNDFQTINDLISLYEAPAFIVNIKNNIPKTMQKNTSFNAAIKFQNVGALAASDLMLRINMHNGFESSIDSVFIGNVATDSVYTLDFILTSPDYDTIGGYDIVFYSPNTNSSGTGGAIRSLQCISGVPAISFDLDSLNPTTKFICFQNNSVNATSYLWNFGDGNFSTEPNPCHIFEASGTVVVTLTAYNECGSAVDSNRYQKILYLSSLGVEDVTNQVSNITIVPNPNTGEFTVYYEGVSNEPVEVSVLNLLGQKVLPVSKESLPGNKVKINLGHVPQGMYLLMLENESSIAFRKFLISR